MVWRSRQVETADALMSTATVCSTKQHGEHGACGSRWSADERLGAREGGGACRAEAQCGGGWSCGKLREPVWGIGRAAEGMQASMTYSRTWPLPRWRQQQQQRWRGVHAPASSMVCAVVMALSLCWVGPLGSRAELHESDKFNLLGLRETLLTMMESGGLQLASWNDSVNPCKMEEDSLAGGLAPVWQGVLCNDAPVQRIIQLNLTMLGLKGEIPHDFLANFEALDHLDMSGNDLTGGIPLDFSQLTALTYLSFQQNQLSGPIPDFLGYALTNLQHLELSDNRLNDSLPESMGQLSALTYLNVAQNQLEGGLPLPMGDLSQLKHLVGYSNRFSGDLPQWLGQLTSLTRLELKANAFTGSIPAELSQAVTLRSILLDNNLISGELHPDLGDLWQLEGLYLANNSIEGSLPDSFSQLSNLKALDLSRNPKLAGNFMDSLSLLVALESLYLQQCVLTSALPESLGSLTAMQELFLSGSQIPGHVPSSLGGLAQLSVLYADDNLLDGVIPTALCGLARVVELSLSRNALEGSIPACLLQLPVLEKLYLADNRLTGDLPVNPRPGTLAFQFSHNCMTGAPNQRPSCLPHWATPFASPPPFDIPQTPQEPPPQPSTDAATQPPPAPAAVAAGAASSGSTGTPTSTTAPTSTPTSAATASHWMLIALLAVAIVVVVAIAAAVFMQWSSLMGAGGATGNRTDDAMAVTEYGLSKIKKATKNFTTVYGRGSFGTVYLAEGFRPDQVDPRVIVKRAHDPLKLGEFLFKCKVEVLARARHRYLVNLLGYCVGKGERILVYEYLPNGSLFDRLHRPELEPLPWETRVKIAVNVACALEYLHHGCSPPLAHRAVTSSNILLSADMSAKLSDFGIARGSAGSSASFEDSPARMRRGRGARSGGSSTRGGSVDRTNDPSVLPSSSASSSTPHHQHSLSMSAASSASLLAMDKVDVYAFGVVLLELITGQKAMKEVHITSVVAPFLQDPQMMPLMVDPQLGGYFNQSELIELASIARECCHDDPSQRPTMREVLSAIEDRLRIDANLFDSLDQDEVLAAAAGFTFASTAGGVVGHGATGGAGGSNRSGPSTPTWQAIENLAMAIKNVLMSPRARTTLQALSPTSALTAQQQQQQQNEDDMELATLLPVPRGNTFSAHNSSAGVSGSSSRGTGGGSRGRAWDVRR